MGKFGMIRTTVMLPANLKANLDCLSKVEGRKQSAIIRAALGDYIKSKGLHPDKRPTLRISYEEAKP